MRQVKLRGMRSLKIEDLCEKIKSVRKRYRFEARYQFAEGTNVEKRVHTPHTKCSIFHLCIP